MRALVGEAIDLVLDAPGGSAAHALDDAGEHRAAVEGGTDDFVRALVGVGDPARHLRRMLLGAAEKLNTAPGQVAGLLGEKREVDAAVDARRVPVLSRLR